MALSTAAGRSAPERKPASPPHRSRPAGVILQPPPRLERKSGALHRLAFDCELKFDEAGDEGTISGYASVFGLLDRGGDIVEKGAFKKTLADLRRRKALPPMLWQHDCSNPVGVWTKLEEDEKGLKVEGKLALDYQRAADARTLIKAGAIGGLSIGYLTRDSDIDRATGARHLKQVDLWEISLVTFPMLPEATITGVKAGGDFDPQEWERAFRDEGLTNREAKLAVSVVRKQAVLRDAGPTGPTLRDGAGMLMSLRKAAAAFRD